MSDDTACTDCGGSGWCGQTERVCACQPPAPKMTADTAPAKCAKPGCGARRLIGKPCTDGDCPQQWVHHSEVSALVEAARREAVQKERESIAGDFDSHRLMIHGSYVAQLIRARSTEEQA